jgi:uncharacterized protein YndB with AHSA1/START domain
MTTITFDLSVSMTAEKAWAALSDPQQRAAWFGGAYEIDPREGGTVRIDLPDDGVHATGVVRSYGPPHVIEHTFVDDAAPGVTSVCTWGVTRTVDGCVVSFRHDGATADLTTTWRRAFDARTRIDHAAELLRAARRVLLVSYITEEVPRALVRAGIEVLVKSGPGPDQWSVPRLDDDTLVFDPRTTPLTPVDIVHLDVGSLFDDNLDLAVELGASTYWAHSGRTHPAEPHDEQGTWLPDDVSALQREKTEARGLRYLDDVFIADAARTISR